MSQGANVVFGFVSGVGMVGLAHVVWLLWTSRDRSVKWPRHYRVICTGCANHSTTDTGAR
jgi:hypothetical protein